jgi:hypothetical protein
MRLQPLRDDLASYHADSEATEVLPVEVARGRNLVIPSRKGVGRLLENVGSKAIRAPR